MMNDTQQPETMSSDKMRCPECGCRSWYDSKSSEMSSALFQCRDCKKWNTEVQWELAYRNSLESRVAELEALNARLVEGYLEQEKCPVCNILEDGMNRQKIKLSQYRSALANIAPVVERLIGYIQRAGDVGKLTPWRDDCQMLSLRSEFLHLNSDSRNSTYQQIEAIAEVCNASHGLLSTLQAMQQIRGES